MEETGRELQTSNSELQTSEEIPNKVAKSPLVTLSLEDYYPEGERIELDLKDWLYEGVMLREKDFRESVQNHDWERYRNAYVAIYCSEDAIIPQWAYLLLGTKLEGIARKVVYGSREMLESILMDEVIQKADFSEYEGKPVIVKGCGHLPIPPHAYLAFASQLKPYVKNLMFGEACSTVPIYKEKKKKR